MAASTMNVSLPDSMKAFVDECIADEGYGTVSEYVRQLIRADQKRHEEEKLEKLLLERLQSGKAVEWNLEDVKKALRKRIRR
jgi:antitoxin ParD1/3/4